MIAFFHQSQRNPFTFRLLSGLTAIGFLTGCQPGGPDPAQSREDILKYTEEIQTLKQSLDELAPQSDLAESSDQKVTETTAAVKKADELAAQLESNVAGKDALLSAYQTAFRPRMEFAAGDELGDFTLKSGKEIKGGVVTAIRGAQLGIRHSGGVGYFATSDLPESFSDRYDSGPEISPRPPEIGALLAGIAGTSNSGTSSINRTRPGTSSSQAPRSTANTSPAMNEKAKARSSAAGRKAEIYVQIKALRSNHLAQERAKRELKGNWATKSLPPSESDQKRLLAPYDRNIAVIKAKMEELEKELKEVR